MSKRANGEGSIYFDKNKGVWIAAVSINGRRIKRSAPTQREARSLKDDLSKSASRLVSKDKTLRTVSDLLSNWHDSQVASDDKSAATLDATRWAISHLVSYLGSIRLEKLNFEEIERAFKALAGPNHQLSRSSLVKIRSVLNQACRWGVRRGSIPDNPVPIVELPKTKSARESRSLSKAEVENFRSVVARSPNEVLWLIFLILGLRSGEARSLLWKDWDRKKASLAIRRNVRRIDGVQTITDEMKTPAAKRTLALPEAITILLDDHYELAKAKGQGEPEDLIFPTSGQRPIDGANLRRELRRLCKDAGIPAIRVHELRHTCASLLADAGVPAERLADILGHRDIRTTLGTYRHAISASVDDHLETMNSIFTSR
jgi:integrase